jgi:hypothetical protein
MAMWRDVSESNGLSMVVEQRDLTAQNDGHIGWEGIVLPKSQLVQPASKLADAGGAVQVAPGALCATGATVVSSVPLRD